MAADKTDIKKLINNPSFVRWVKGYATTWERTYWDRWLIKNNENRGLAKRAQAEIAGFSIRPTEAPDTKKAWSRLQYKLENRRNRKQFYGKKLAAGHINKFIRIAAVFTIAILAGLLISRQHNLKSQFENDAEPTVVSTVAGEQKTVVFSDGSEIIMNGNSQIQYSLNPENPLEVEVYLHGEAHFSIQSRQGIKPFQVYTDDGIVSVLGTQFVVSARSGKTQVVLENGSLALEPNHTGIRKILEPGQLGEIKKAYEDVEIRYVNTELYNAWMYGRIAFDKAGIEDIAEHLEHTFGVAVEIRDSSVAAERITGSIESSNLGVITSALARMLNVPIYEREDEGIIYVGEP